MQYLSAIFGGIAASALFWFFDKNVTALPEAYRNGGMVGCFVVFAAIGYWLSTKSKPVPAPAPSEASIASGFKAHDVDLEVDGVNAPGSGKVDVLSHIDASGNVKGRVSNVKIGQ